jgi:hypothetical protein
MVGSIDDHREAYGVEPICSVLPIAPSVYYEQKARQADPRRPPKRLARHRCGHTQAPALMIPLAVLSRLRGNHLSKSESRALLYWLLVASPTTWPAVACGAPSSRWRTSPSRRWAPRTGTAASVSR